MSKTFKISNGDVSYVTSGQPLFTRDSKEKLGQDLNECTVVPTDDIGFGMGLSQLETAIEDPDTMPSIIENLIVSGVNRFIALQQQNQRLIRDDNELVASVASVQAAFVTSGNRTDFNFAYSVNSVAGASVAATPLTVKGAVS